MQRRFRFLLAGVGLLFGLFITYYPMKELQRLGFLRLSLAYSAVTVALGGLLIALMFWAMAPLLVRWGTAFTHFIESRLTTIPATDLVPGAVGLLVGLAIGYLLSLPLSVIPIIGHILPIVASVLFGWAGLVVGLKKKEEFFLSSWLSKKTTVPAGTVRESVPKILDTSVIIDGRVADICKTGFLEGPLLVPGFVLEELRHIADSSDVLKRNRGRRGLDILNKIQKELDVPVEIYEKDIGGHMEVDSKLLRLAKVLGGKVITNDYNLNKVAEFQGVPVLNINELANAVKPVVLPGEEMVVHLVKDGKEAGQGVAYLDDGTMIVVDGGKKYMGETVTVLVTSVLQTAAGRMIFAKPKVAEMSRSHLQPF